MKRKCIIWEAVAHPGASGCSVLVPALSSSFYAAINQHSLGESCRAYTPVSIFTILWTGEHNFDFVLGTAVGSNDYRRLTPLGLGALASQILGRPVVAFAPKTVGKASPSFLYYFRCVGDPRDTGFL